MANTDEKRLSISDWYPVAAESFKFFGIKKQNNFLFLLWILIPVWLLLLERLGCCLDNKEPLHRKNCYKFICIFMCS